MLCSVYRNRYQNRTQMENGNNEKEGGGILTPLSFPRSVAPKSSHSPAHTFLHPDTGRTCLLDCYVVDYNLCHCHCFFKQLHMCLLAQFIITFGSECWIGFEASRPVYQWPVNENSAWAFSCLKTIQSPAILNPSQLRCCLFLALVGACDARGGFRRDKKRRQIERKMFGPTVFLVIVHLSFGKANVSLCLLCTSNTVAPWVWWNYSRKQQTLRSTFLNAGDHMSRLVSGAGQAVSRAARKG